MTTVASPTNRKTLFLRAARGESTDRVPVWMMRQAGRYLPEYRALRAKHSFLETCKTPELAAEVSLQPFRILGVDAIIVFSDILIPAEAMGIPLEIGDGGPKLGKKIQSISDVRALRDFDPETETRFVGDAIRAIAKEVGPDVPVLGFAGAPWTLACYMIEGHSKDGFPSAKKMLYSEPAALRALLDKIAVTTTAYLKSQIAAGATAVQLFDTWAGELSASDYREFALPPLQKIISEIRHTGTPVILYSKASGHLPDSLKQSGADVLSVDWRLPLSEYREKLGPKIALQGNVDPCVLLGPADGIRNAVKACVSSLAGVGHILNLGHGILPSTPVENAKLFIETAQSLLILGRAAAKQ